MGKTAENTAKALKHKPSKKIALEEVLVSLQDLVSNEFADKNATSDSASPREETASDQPNVLHASGAGSAVKGRKRGRPRKHKPAEIRPEQPAEPDDYTYSQEQKDLFTMPPAELETRVKSAKPTPKQNKVQNKTQNKTAKTPKPAVKKLATTLETHQIPTKLELAEQASPDRSSSKTSRDPIEPKPMAQESTSSAENLPEQSYEEQSSLGWADDIPVLTDVVDLDEIDTAQLQNAVDQSLANKDLTPEARQIAVKVAAKLNIEMRESGGEQLDIKTIMRLQSLLKEALEPKD